ncbi:glycoside hydrolase family 16 protein [Laccaria amethystina LaAM-08-1]|uniref:Unplaced genomic scaffold K443scaffold_15, whole genome shotgun sequence n=1 Tax=Laccaria amethystina LaAM-08-1 TaxID=1095629 RepID=A0A0C9Y9V9_9AGAR|nr:glycoside hydrolase family 16 protein [Laccaria amethystina LaAM-08-1]
MLPTYFLIFIIYYPAVAVPQASSWLPSLSEHLWPSRNLDLASGNTINYNPNGSSFLWLPQDSYSGKTFFDLWDFFTGPDPTNGQVNYVNETVARQAGLVYVQDNGVVIMKADNVTSLPQGVYRNSVRISSQAQYNTGLFILDLNRAPWGCAVWPAFWTVGGNWPYNGEVDIIEGVHDNEHNQVAWHTAPGCTLDTTANFTGTISSSDGVNHTDCNSFINSNSGCCMTEWSRASYGPYFDSQGGGVFAMKWDENSIAVWSFYRVAIPEDVIDGTPNPSRWGAPSAVLEASDCNIGQFFANHSIIFDITLCGDWAGNSYATSGCPGTCEQRLMDPANFQNASWSINSLKVYRKQLLSARVTNSATSKVTMEFATLCLMILLRGLLI